MRFWVQSMVTELEQPLEITISSCFRDSTKDLPFVWGFMSSKFIKIPAPTLGTLDLLPHHIFDTSCLVRMVQLALLNFIASLSRFALQLFHHPVKMHSFNSLYFIFSFFFFGLFLCACVPEQKCGGQFYAESWRWLGSNSGYHAWWQAPSPFELAGPNFKFLNRL